MTSASLTRRNTSLVSSMHCPLLHRALPLRSTSNLRQSLPTAVPTFASLCRLLCQAHQIVTHQGLALAVPCESMPCSLLNQAVPSPCATLPSSPSQCPHLSMQVRTSPRPCGSSPSRSGLYRHGALQTMAVLFTLNSYPRNPIPPQFIPNHINALPSPLLITA